MIQSKMKLMPFRKVAWNQKILLPFSRSTFANTHIHTHKLLYTAPYHIQRFENVFPFFFSLSIHRLYDEAFVHATHWQGQCFFTQCCLWFSQLVPLTNTNTHAHTYHRLLELFRRTVFAICCFDANRETTKRSECAKQFKHNFVKFFSYF